MKPQNPPALNLKRVHVIGICGTLMGAFAAYLKRQGVHVTGSDQNIYPPMSDVLKNAGIPLYSGYRAENLTEPNGKEEGKPDLVVIGNVIRKDNPEARAAIDGGYSYSSLPEAMEKLFLPVTRNIVVAGTHGKTTTSTLMAHVLVQCGKDPNYFIGGVSHDLPFSFHISKLEENHCFVLEGDEYDTAFWDKVPKFNHYLPDDVILTSVEYDHADIYPDMDSVVRAFQGLVSRIRPEGRLIACFDYPWVRELSRQSRSQVVSYGSSNEAGARFSPADIRVDPEGLTHFSILDGERVVDEIVMQMSGAHNVSNALAVWLESREIGLDPKAVREAFRSFRGVKRRQEVRGEIAGVMVMDDFAHHPTAVRETLLGLRLKYPSRRIVAVFEPRSATSRRKVFQKDYVEAFGGADLIFISSPFDQSRIAEGDQFSSEALVKDLKKLKKQARLVATPDEGVVQVTEAVRSGDLVAVLSNGGFGGFVSKLLERLARKALSS